MRYTFRWNLWMKHDRSIQLDEHEWYREWPVISTAGWRCQLRIQQTMVVLREYIVWSKYYYSRLILKELSRFLNSKLCIRKHRYAYDEFVSILPELRCWISVRQRNIDRLDFRDKLGKIIVIYIYSRFLVSRNQSSSPLFTLSTEYSQVLIGRNCQVTRFSELIGEQLFYDEVAG